MGRLFQLDNPVWRLLNKITDVLILSLLFVVTGIFVITTGASLVSLYYNMFKLSDDREGHIVSGYFKTFKECFKKVTPMWCVCLLVGLILFGDIYICFKMPSPLGSFMIAFVAIIVVVFAMIITYLFPFLAMCEGDIKKILYLSFMMSVKEFLRTLFMIFITGIMIAVGLFVSAPFLVVAPGVIALSHIYIFKEIFNKYNMQLEERESAV